MPTKYDHNNKHQQEELAEIQRRRWESSPNGAIMGVIWGLGYTSSLADAGISPLSYAAQSVLTGAVNSAIPSVSIPVGDYTLNMSIGLGVTPNLIDDTINN